jgi:cyclopropane fatty-acyl-phospholipid synthase-like methyltransferase
MIWLDVLVILMICFGGVLLFGAPYLPTLKPQVKAALELLDLKPGATMLELGCGDGKVLIAAAKQGINAVGYELNPIMAAVAWLRTRRYRKQVKVIWGDFWQRDWPPADAIFIFLLTKHMPRFNQKVEEYPHKPIKVVSHAFEIPDRRPKRQKAGVFLYKYD